MSGEQDVPQEVCPVTEALHSAVCSVVAMLEKPEDIQVMAPLM
ncbi:AraC family transcriptional regulator, partial [Morganella morganii]|nr:AraC family transcriptional regulator [Morganella morganii]